MARWAAAGIIGQIRDQLSSRIRRQTGKGPSAVATFIGSQSVKAAENVGKDSRGYDAGRKINSAASGTWWSTREGFRCISWSPPMTCTTATPPRKSLGEAVPGPNIKTVSRPKDSTGFVVLTQHSETLITWAAITLVTCRLAREK